jgi:uncharacterized protein (TIGR02001 family)
MKAFCKFLSGPAAAAALVCTAAAPTVAAGELSANAGVASMYLWRGLDLGDGSPAVHGGLQYDVAGAYVGIWGSSGDSSLGNEYDLYAGYGGEIGAFTYDISIWNYNYSDAGLRGMLNDRDDTFAELTEIIFTLGFGPVTFQYYDNIAGNTGYQYFTLAGSYDKFTAKVGHHEPEDSDTAFTHLDLTYAYNDRLSFTLSKVIDDKGEGSYIDADTGEVVQTGYDDDLNFIVSYTLPIDL